MKDQISAHDLVERRFECLDQRMRKLLNESDGIGKGYLAPLGKHEFPRRRIERGKQLIVAEHARIGERIEEARFAGVGVARKGYLEHAAFVPPLALKRAHFVQLLQLAFDRGYAFAHHPAVDLELAFALAEPRSDAAAHAVRGKVGPHAPKTRKKVLVLSKPHLQTPLFARRMQREYIEDQRRSIDYLDLLRNDPLKVRLLRWGKLVIEYHDIGAMGAAEVGNFLGLSRADERTRIRRIELLRRYRNHVGAGGVGEPLEFCKAFGNGPRRIAAIDPHEHGTLAYLFYSEMLGLGHGLWPFVRFRWRVYE